MYLKAEAMDDSCGDMLKVEVTCYEIECDNTCRITVSEFGITMPKGWTQDTQDGRDYGFQCPACKKIPKDKTKDGSVSTKPKGQANE